MKLEDLIKEISEFCEKETQKIITELQFYRFENDGDFNGNEMWQGNSPKVIKDKGFDAPLQDSGELRRQLETKENWKLKPKFVKDTLKLTIPEEENFTNSKYDVLQTGGKVSPYVSPRGNKININSVPARNFKKLNSQDMEWIKNKLVESIRKRYT